MEATRVVILNFSALLSQLTLAARSARSDSAWSRLTDISIDHRMTSGACVTRLSVVSPECIFSVRDGLKMIWIYTMPYTTKVIQLKTFRYRAKFLFPQIFVDQHYSGPATSKSYCGVSVAESSRPQPVRAGPVALGQEDYANHGLDSLGYGCQGSRHDPIVTHEGT